MRKSKIKGKNQRGQIKANQRGQNRLILNHEANKTTE